jgi:hypothetical protein
MNYIRKYRREEKKKQDTQIDAASLFKVKGTEDITIPPPKRRRIISTPK